MNETMMFYVHLATGILLGMYFKSFFTAQESWYGHPKWKYLWAIWAERTSEDYDGVAKWFYFVKATICILLGLRQRKSHKDYSGTGLGTVAQRGPEGEYNSYSFEFTEVGDGFFKNWYWGPGHDTSA